MKPVSIALGFAIATALVGGVAAQMPRPAPHGVVTLHEPAMSVPAWKACLLANAGSPVALMRAIRRFEPAYVEGRTDAFSPCLAEESALLPMVDGSTAARHFKLRGLMMLEIAADIMAGVR